jgi:hypothetical protein
MKAETWEIIYQPFVDLLIYRITELQISDDAALISAFCIPFSNFQITESSNCSAVLLFEVLVYFLLCPDLDG